MYTFTVLYSVGGKSVSRIVEADTAYQASLLAGAPSFSGSRIKRWGASEVQGRFAKMGRNIEGNQEREV